MGKGIGNAREYESVCHWLYKHNDSADSEIDALSMDQKLINLEFMMKKTLVTVTLRASRYTYVTATGSDDMISRIFSQPNVVMYAIE